MQNIKIVKYENKHFDLYESFVENSINGTIFHERKFISYHPEERFDDCSLLFFRGEKLVAVFPAAIIQKENIKILKSHPGTSYGGLIIKENLSYSFTNSLFEKLEEYCIKNNINFIEFRHSPRIFLKNPLDQIEFVLINRGYIREAEELATCYDLSQIKYLTQSQYINYYNNNTNTKARQNIKKAISHKLNFKIINNKNEISTYYNILENNLKKYNTKPVHSLEEIIKLFSLYPERVKIVVAELNGKILGGFLIFNINSIGWHIFYSALDYNYIEYKPIHFCLFMLKKYLSEMSYKYLNYGISTENSGKYINESLLSFKESFNGIGVIRTYWQKEILY